MGWSTKYTGEIMDSTLEKGRQMKTSNNGWIRMQSSESKPTDLNNLKNTGNYITEYWTNGPDILANTKITPVNITVNDIGGTLYQFLSAMGVIIFSRQILEDGTITPWIIDQSNGALIRDTKAPANPVDGKTLWLDRSDSNNIILKLYINGEWVEIRSKNIMKKSVYDPQGKATDIYEYIEKAINKGNLDGGITDMTDYSKHIQDSSIHITEDELTTLKNLPTTETLKERTDEIKLGIKTSVETGIGTDKTKYETVTSSMKTLNDKYTVHTADTNIHPTDEDRKKWNNKADKNHTHRAEDHTVKISYDKVTGGIPTSVMPYYVKERAYKINSEDELKNITKNPYHNGDVFYKEKSVGEENTWHLLIDDTVLGTGTTLKAIRGNMPSRQNWRSVCYGKDKYVAVAYNSNVFAYSSDGITWTQGTLPVTAGWEPVCYGKDTFVALNHNNGNVFAYSSDGITWTQGTLPVEEYWYSVCYGKDKFVAISNGTTIFIYSSDGITWTQGTLPVAGRWYSVCYGKDKFVAITGNDSTSTDTNIFAYSLDGITWTHGTLSSNQKWYSVCYGKDKFVAVDWTWESNLFIYSLDGITWTQGTLPGRAQWQDVCYGKDKFVAVAPYTSTFVYSTDGITWTKGTLLSSELDWYSVCYGKDKFVVVAQSTNVSAYITDIPNPFIKMETNTASNLLVTNAVNKPTTMEGYGITDLINKSAAETKVNEIITTAKSRVGNHTAEEIAKVGYNLQVLNFANTDLDEIEMIFDYLERENVALNTFASYPEPKLATD